MTKVLFLYTREDEEKSEELKDLLQARLGSAVTINSIMDALSENSTLEDELFQSACVVLVYSQQCEEYLEDDGSEIQDDCVTFDGSVIKAFLKEDDVIGKVLLVHFGWRPEKWVSERLAHTKRVFHLNGKLGNMETRIDLMMDAIRGLLRVETNKPI